jgi:hypothetical protein
MPRKATRVIATTMTKTINLREGGTLAGVDIGLDIADLLQEYIMVADIRFWQSHERATGIYGRAYGLELAFGQMVDFNPRQERIVRP